MLRKSSSRNRSRREFLGRSAALLAGAGYISTLALTRSALAADASRPNIIYIVADDLGWKDLGFRGSDIKTPNLDKLAATGVLLDSFYVQPMCTPTRAALMTGRYPLRYGLQSGVIPSAGSYGLSLDEYILPQLLKDAGYETALIGKWHLGHAKTEYWPRQRGFDYFYGALVGEIDHFDHTSHGIKDWYRNNNPVDDTGYDNILFGNDAVALIERHDQTAPLFLYLAFTAPHTPFQAPQEYIDRYSGIADEQRRKYAAMVSVLDDQVGNLVEALRAANMLENTIIAFQSDNGGVRSAMFAGESPVQGELPADNGPYRDGKGTLYEGGTRTSAIINWPGKIKPAVITGLVHVTDMYPTLASIAGAKLGKNKALDGIDMWPTLGEGAPSPRSELVYNVDPMAGAVREGDWKLVWTAALPGKIELFNIASDPSERTNLADKNPEIVKKLQSRIVELASEMAPPLLLSEAIKLTFGSPPVSADPATILNAGD